MTKKLLLLILALPLIMMISLFTTTSTVSLAINVPVSGIDIIGSNIVYLSLDEAEKYQIDYTVYPTNAYNQEVTFSTEAVGDARLAGLEYKDGYLTPTGVGIAKVYLTTVDGGFKDSFIVQVDSESLQSIESSIGASDVYVGDKISITTEFVPANSKDKRLTYTSSDPTVAAVDAKGFITAVGKGTSTITIASVINPSITDTVTINVHNKDIMDLGHTNIVSWEKTGSFNISIDDISIDYELTYRVLDANNNEVANSADIISISLDRTNEATGKIVLNYEFLNENYFKELNIEVSITTMVDSGTSTISKVCSVKRVKDIEVSFAYDKTPSFTIGQTSFLFFNLEPADADVSYRVVSDNDNVMVEMVDDLILLAATKAGVSTITLEVTSNEDTSLKKTTSIDVVVAPKAFNIEEMANTYGIENIWTIGKSEYNATYNEVDSEFKVNMSYGNTVFGEGFTENISWVSSTDKVSIDKNGNFKVVDANYTGMVEFKGIYQYGDYKLETAPFTIRVVGDAINVDNYLELLKATQNARVVVLHKSIKEDFGYDANGNIYYTEIPTTYDWTYYKNLGYTEAPKVKVLLEIKNDMYGNGYTINAHNATNALLIGGSDGSLVPTSNTLFKGPLHFVGITESGSSAISVKAQDNIIFGVYENVSLNNIELRGCDLEADPNGNYDLVDLTYTGTVVEVLGDNVDVNYSRLTNGRMVMRIFGDINDPNKVINVDIKNSILSGAREFIIRMGSNAFVEGSFEESSPSIDPTDASLTEFPVYPKYRQMNKAAKEAYDKKYVKTFVNVKDSAFKDSGIFSIGVDSHFSGPALADGKKVKFGNYDFSQVFKDWYDLAKTSYGSKLTFEGQVRIYDWKMVDNIDSSTLIDITMEKIMVGTKEFELKRMEFNVSEMLTNLVGRDQFKQIAYKKDGKQYVHGGIAFFGGGKNYGVFENATNSKWPYAYNGYPVSLSDVNRPELIMAAGEEEFYFLLHDSTTQGFLPQNQEAILKSADAYSFVYKGTEE